MKKTVVDDYSLVNKHPHAGESYGSILNYFYPELVTSFILYSALNLLDSYFISQIQVSSAYASLAVTNPIFHFITKVADAFCVAMIILCGQYNGVGQFTKAGRSLTDAFWTTCIIGAIVAGALAILAPFIYAFFGVGADMIDIGVPFLRLKALGVFFNFVFFALVGFLRGVKNTKAPMFIFMLGALVFVFCDYIFIFGACGCPCLEFQGSALASVIQYGVMLLAALIYILSNAEYKKYAISIFDKLNVGNILQLLKLSWPVMLDKASLAICHIWLSKVIANVAHAGSQSSAKTILSSFVVIKDMEKFAFLPALALAQVITFLVSNDYRAHNWQGIRNNIKKVLLLATIMVGLLLCIFSFWPHTFIKFFDRHNHFTEFAATIMPIVSILVLFDLLQLILSASLRGAANVKSVMWVRLSVSIFYFFPVSYMLSCLHIESSLIKFILIYSSLHIGNAIMSMIFINRFTSDVWKKQSI